MNCLRKSFEFQLPQHQWNAYSAQVKYIQQHRARTGNKLGLLSELVLKKVTANCLCIRITACFIDSESDTLLTVIIYSTYYWCLEI